MRIICAIVSLRVRYRFPIGVGQQVGSLLQDRALPKISTTLVFIISIVRLLSSSEIFNPYRAMVLLDTFSSLHAFSSTHSSDCNNYFCEISMIEVHQFKSTTCVHTSFMAGAVANDILRLYSVYAIVSISQVLLRCFSPPAVHAIAIV